MIRHFLQKYGVNIGIDLVGEFQERLESAARENEQIQ